MEDVSTESPEFVLTGNKEDYAPGMIFPMHGELNCSLWFRH